MVTVIYNGRANVYINFPTEERPEGYSFIRGVLTDIPASLWPLVEATGLFERKRPDPASVELPSLPESVVDPKPHKPESEGPGEP